MKEFLFVYRNEYSAMPAPTPEQIQATMKRWMDWYGSMAAQNKLKDRGNRLEPGGKVVKGQTIVTDGPYAEIKETIGGYTIVSAASIEEAVELAKGCPILTMGGKVEVRPVAVM